MRCIRESATPCDTEAVFDNTGYVLPDFTLADMAAWSEAMTVIVLDNAFEFSHVEVGDGLRVAALDCPLSCE